MRHFLNGLICISGICEIFLLVLLFSNIPIAKRLTAGMAALVFFLYAGITSVLTFSLSSFSFAIGWNAEPREILIPTIGLFLSIPPFIITLIYTYADAYKNGPMTGGLLGILSLIGLVILEIMLGINTIGITQTCVSMGIFGLTVLLWLLFRFSSFFVRR